MEQEKADQDFWKFVDGFVESPEILQNFCQQHGYLLESRVGGGGFGSVYRLKDAITGEELAMKILDFSAHQDGVEPCFYSREDQVYCEVRVKVSATLEEFLSREKVNIAVGELLPFLVADFSEIWDEEAIGWENPKYAPLLAVISKEKMSPPPQSVPGFTELWLAEQIDPEKLGALSVWDILHLAPDICTQRLSTREEGTWRTVHAGREIFPMSLEISWHDLAAEYPQQGVRALLREYLYDPVADDPYWKWRWVTDFPAAISETWQRLTFRLNTVWERYSLPEIQLRFPDFFRIRLTLNLPASLALPYLTGERKQEVKRLMAVKNEIITGNATRHFFKGFNTAVAPPLRLGSNVFIISPLLSDPQKILPARFVQVLEEEGERERRVLLAFPPLIHFLRFLTELFQSSPWEIGDIKETNFKLDATGQWQLVDYGGHLLRYLKQRGWQYLVGSNDYASYSLFHALGASLEEDVDGQLLDLAHGEGSRWFSAVKTIVRMLSGREADRLRGTDLNNALFQDFQKYHEDIFTNLSQLLLSRDKGLCRYRSFPVTDDDVADLSKDKDMDMETALRRFLFIIGLSLTAEPAWSILDPKMQERMCLCSRKPYAHSSWEVAVKDDKIILSECPAEVADPMRKGLTPGTAEKLLKAFFPGLEESFTRREAIAQKRRQILGILAQMGVLWAPCELDKFDANLRKRLGQIAKLPWLIPECLKKIWELRRQSNAMIFDSDNKDRRDADLPEATAQRLQEQLSSLLKKSELPLDETCDVLRQVIRWQRLCFHRYLFGKIDENCQWQIDVKRTQAFFQDRWTLLRYAFIEKDEETLQYAFLTGWIEGLEKRELQKVRFMADTCNQEKHAMLLMVREWMRARDHLEKGSPEVLAGAYRRCKARYEKVLEEYPFFPPQLKGKPWTASILRETLGDAPQEIFGDCCERWRKAKTWSELEFPAAALAASREFLDLCGEIVPGLWLKIHEKLARCGIAPLAPVPANWTRWQEQNGIYLAQLHEIDESFDPAALSGSPLLVSAQIYEIVEHLGAQTERLRDAVLGHFLCAAMPENVAHAVYVRGMLEKLLPEERDFAAEALLQELRRLERAPDAPFAAQHGYYRGLFLWLKSAEAILVKKSPDRVDLPREREKDTTLRTSPVIEGSFDPEFLKGWQGDRLKNRIARFLGSMAETGLWDHELREALEDLLLCFYRENGLYLPELQEREGDAVAELYRTLYRATGGFRNIPPALEDIRRIAALGLARIDPAQKVKDFARLLPVEVQAPHFPRSVLVEFLEYQMDISVHGGEDKARQTRKNILLVQLRGEWEYMSARHRQILEEYPQYRRLAENLALLRPDLAGDNLSREAVQEWPRKIKIFEDYLSTTHTILEQEEKNIPWNWRQFLKNCDNSFVQRIYPDIEDRRFGDIYLLLFDLSPLPSLKETREFMKKCRHFNLDEEQRQKIAAILSDGAHSADQRFAQAKEYLECRWSPPEEEVRLAIYRAEIPEQDRGRFWGIYLEERKKLAVTYRIAPNPKLISQLQQEQKPRQWMLRLQLEIWLARFQRCVDPLIVRYFARELETMEIEKLMKICELLEMSNTEDDCEYLFSCLFQEHLCFPKLQNLSNGLGRMYQDMADAIIDRLSRYPSEVPLELEYNSLKEIEEKAADGWPLPKILTSLYERIAGERTSGT